MPRFTPRLHDGRRIDLPHPNNGEDVRGRGYRGRVIDPATVIHYDVFGAACPLETCYCDAVAVPVERNAPQATEPGFARAPAPSGHEGRS